jgi:hypothetical protein
MDKTKILVISLLLPSAFQLIFGLLSICKKTKLTFKRTYLLSISTQLFLSIIVYFYYLMIFSESFDKCGNRIINLQLGLLFCGIVLTSIILLLFVIKYFTKTKTKK